MQPRQVEYKLGGAINSSAQCSLNSVEEYRFSKSAVLGSNPRGSAKDYIPLNIKNKKMTWRDLLKALKEMDEGYLDTAVYIQDVNDPNKMMMMCYRLQNPGRFLLEERYNNHYLVVQ